MCNKNSACAITAHVKKRFSVVKRYTDNVQLFFFVALSLFHFLCTVYRIPLAFDFQMNNAISVLNFTRTSVACVDEKC